MFARATAEAERPSAGASGEGLSLDELLEVAGAAGLDRNAVAAAARAVAAGEPVDGRERVAGVPLGVRRSASLAAAPDDALWEAVVADAREAFGARGRTTRRGDAREWRNGALRVTLEPEGSGSRLVLRTHRRGDTPGLLWLGAVLLVLAGAAALGWLATGGSGLALVAAVLAGAGVLDLGLVGGRQAAWARERERQMEGVVRRAVGRGGGAWGAAGAGRAGDDGVEDEIAEAPSPLLHLDALSDESPSDAETARARRRASG